MDERLVSLFHILPFSLPFASFQLERRSRRDSRCCRHLKWKTTWRFRQQEDPYVAAREQTHSIRPFLCPFPLRLALLVTRAPISDERASPTSCMSGFGTSGARRTSVCSSAPGKGRVGCGGCHPHHPAGCPSLVSLLPSSHPSCCSDLPHRQLSREDERLHRPATKRVRTSCLIGAALRRSSASVVSTAPSDADAGVGLLLLVLVLICRRRRRCHRTVGARRRVRRWRGGVDG